MSNKFAIFDLDNCIADDAWRIPLVDWSAADSGKRYQAYHEACEGDKTGNRHILMDHINNGDHLFFLTGRPNAVRQKTVAWLQKRLTEALDSGIITRIPTWGLLMRNDGDERRTVDIKRSQLQSLAGDWGQALSDCTGAYDDREDIVEMYKHAGLPAKVVCIHNVDAYNPPAPAAPAIVERAAPTLHTAADAMMAGAALFAERNGVYRDNYLRVAPIMAALFPEGAPPGVLHNSSFHLLELMVVKLTRFAISGLTHKDSIEDTMVYAAMIAANIQRGLSAANQESKK